MKIQVHLIRTRSLNSHPSFVALFTKHTTFFHSLFFCSRPSLSLSFLYLAPWRKGQGVRVPSCSTNPPYRTDYSRVFRYFSESNCADSGTLNCSLSYSRNKIALARDQALSVQWLESVTGNRRWKRQRNMEFLFFFVIISMSTGSFKLLIAFSHRF